MMEFKFECGILIQNTLGPQLKQGRVGSYLVEDVLLKLYMKSKAKYYTIENGFIKDQSQKLSLHLDCLFHDAGLDGQPESGGVRSQS